MANKYELFLVPTQLDRDPKQQPWYKERLQAKYLSSPIAAGSSGWRFINEAADDFRNGPQSPNLPLVVKGSAGIAPVIVGAEPEVPPWKIAVQRGYSLPLKPLTQSSILSSVPERKRKRMRHVNQLEESLKEESKAIQFEQFQKEHFDIEQGESERGDNDGMDPVEGVGMATSAEQARRLSSSEENESGCSQESLDAFASVEPDYSRMPVVTADKESALQSAKLHAMQARRKGSTTKSPMRKAVLDDEQLKSVIDQLCTWENGLGNVVKPTLDNVTVYQMFGMGNESKPPPDMSVKILDATSLPTELKHERMPRRAPTPGLPKIADIRTTVTQIPLPKSLEFDDQTKLQKMPRSKLEYGAWYLPKTLWHTHQRGFQLADPMEIKQREEAEREREKRKVPGSDESWAKVVDFNRRKRK